MRLSRLYVKANRLLRRHGKLALFLSHGFVHITLAIVLAICSIGLYTRVQNLNNPTLRQLSIDIDEHTDNDCLESLIIGVNLTGAPIRDGWVKGNDNHIYISAELKQNTDSINLCSWPIKGENINRSVSSCGSIFVKSAQGKLKTSLNFKEDSPFYGISQLDTFSVATTHKNEDGWIGQYWYFVDDMPTLPNSDEIIQKIMWLGYTGESLFKDKRDKSPFYNFWIGIDCPKLISQNQYKEDKKIGIILEFSDRDSLGVYNNPIAFEHIYPEPSILTPTKVAYIGYDKVNEVINNTGISISGTDIKAKSQTDKKIFLYTVLIGTILAFMLDILVELVIKWRNLVRRKNR